ncbi:hypothetical protein, partial [Edaphobacter sp. HDX4]|uniref:hypothetical protein n=1 Tax=Edaphobacter sp. HDX4 TaxID=2794064 RepID=UPI002FE5F2B5
KPNEWPIIAAKRLRWAIHARARTRRLFTPPKLFTSTTVILSEGAAAVEGSAASAVPYPSFGNGGFSP